MLVKVQRSDKWWAISAEYQGKPVFTQARRLRDVETMVTDAYRMFGITVDEPIEIDIQLPDEAKRQVQTAKSAHREAAEASEAAAAAMKAAVADLRNAGLSMRDAATVLGVSHQRIAQLAAASA